jgi:outer membrane lipoprotein-sorting protein
MKTRVYNMMVAMLAVLLSASASPAQEMAPGTTAPQAAAPDPATVIQEIRTAFVPVTDYACTLKTWDRKGDQQRTSIYACSWKTPGQLRLDVLEGDNKGSRIARDAKGEIHGSKGGLLKVVTVKIDASDPRALSLRGRPFWLSGYDAVIQEALAAVEKGWQMRVSGQSTFQNMPCWLLDIERVNDPANPGITADRLWVTRGDANPPWRILKREKFEGTELVSVVEWSNVRTNTGLQDYHFDLKD